MLEDRVVQQATGAAPAEAKPRYDSPVVVPLGELARGSGQCTPGSAVAVVPCSPGSAADGDCTNGVEVGGSCFNGATAGALCDFGSGRD
jgi:hypothetical protein